VSRRGALRLAKLLAGVLGLGLFAWLVHAAGPGEIFEQLRPFGVLGVLLFLTGMAIGYAFDAQAWKRSFPGTSPVSLWRLYWVRVAGESINNTLPSYMGGEPVKALLLYKQGISGPSATVSVVVSKTALLVAMGAFVATGGVAAAWSNRDSEHLPVLIGVALAFGLGLAVFLYLVVLMQRRGLGALLQGLTAKTGLGTAWVERRSQGLRDFDAQMKTFYTEHPGRFWLVTWWNFLGFVAETLEYLIFAWWLNIPLDPVTAYAIAALVNLARVAGFMIPASLGALEGGTVLIFLACGLTEVQALAFSVIRRFRELLWIGVGLALLTWWGLLGPGRAANPAEPASRPLPDSV
jgi:uncharacterized protein (TIRG00374 family)